MKYQEVSRMEHVALLELSVEQAQFPMKAVVAQIGEERLVVAAQSSQPEREGFEHVALRRLLDKMSPLINVS